MGVGGGQSRESGDALLPLRLRPAGLRSPVHCTYRLRGTGLGLSQGSGVWRWSGGWRAAPCPPASALRSAPDLPPERVWAKAVRSRALGPSSHPPAPLPAPPCAPGPPSLRSPFVPSRRRPGSPEVLDPSVFVCDLAFLQFTAHRANAVGVRGSCAVAWGTLVRRCQDGLGAGGFQIAHLPLAPSPTQTSLRPCCPLGLLWWSWK